MTTSLPAIVLTRPPGIELAAEELTFMDHEPVSFEDALAQHRSYVDSLLDAAGNALALGDTVFMELQHARTADRARRTVGDVRLPDFSEFAKEEAGLTCVSVLVPHPSTS